MREVEADLWSLPYDVICITTNCTIQGDGTNPMGGGCAREAAQRWPDMPALYGELMQMDVQKSEPKTNIKWLKVFEDGAAILAFPVKHEIWLGADTALIEESCRQLVEIADKYDYKDVLVPRPGAGLGGLDYLTDVKPICEKYFDDRFVVVGYPQKGK